MSEHHLKELLGRIVEDLPAPDGHRVDTAWDHARRRRRRGTALVAAAAVAVAGTVAGVALATSGDGGRDPAPAPAPTTPGTPSPEPDPGPPVGDYRHAVVWNAPEPEAEASLPWTDSVLPREIDLGADLPDLPPGRSALAVHTVYDEAFRPTRFVVLTTDGASWNLPADHLRANRDEFGNTAALTPPDGGLSPDGRHLFVAQPSSLELYDLETGSWRSIDTPDWLAEGARWLDSETIWVPNGLLRSGLGSTYDTTGRRVSAEEPRVFSDLPIAPADEQYGSLVRGDGDAVAGSFFLAGPVSGAPYTNPEGVVARVDGRTSVLAIAIQGRWKMCCPAVGWISGGLVAFESQGRVLAWRPAGDAVYRVAETTGLTDNETAVSSWAWAVLR